MQYCALVVRVLVALACAIMLVGCEDMPAAKPPPAKPPPAKTTPSVTAIYWIHGDAIQRADAAGTNVTDLVSAGNLGISGGGAVGTISGKLYWGAWSWSEERGGIQRANVDGSGIETLIDDEPIRPISVAVDEGSGKMYWAAFEISNSGPPNGVQSFVGHVKRANLDGSDIETLIQDESTIPVSVALDVANGTMYWIAVSPNAAGFTGYIRRANIDGSAIETLVEDTSIVPVSVALDVANGTMYWAAASRNPLTGYIRRANVDGSGIETVITEPITAERSFTAFLEFVVLDAANGTMYWKEFGGGRNHIRRASLDGSNVEDIGTANILWLIAATGHDVYWAEPRGPSGAVIRSSKTDGSSARDVVVQTALNDSIVLDMSAAKMYWTEPGAIRSANLDGTNVTYVIVDEENSPRDMALDVAGRKIYWTTYRQITEPGPGPSLIIGVSGDIRRANLDGTGVEVVFSEDSSHPDRMALDAVNGKIYWIENSREIRSANFDGTDVEDVVPADASKPEGIAVDGINGKIYWTEIYSPSGSFPGSPEPNPPRVTGRVRRANLDGSDAEVLVAETSSIPYGIALDVANGKMFWAERMYWAAQPDDARKVRIRRADLDGKNAEVLSEVDASYASGLDIGIAVQVR